MNEHQEVYLIMVTKVNNNKFYRMIPKDNGTFDVVYGRVGESGTVCNYPISKWTSKYNEKIRKGYTDQTGIRMLQSGSKEKDEPQYKPLNDKVMNEVMSFLVDCAKQTIKKHYKVSAVEVTQPMINQAQGVIGNMIMISNSHQSDSDRVNQMNDLLLELFSVIPRRMRSVNDYLAKSENDFAEILKREQDLLDVMASQVVSEAKGIDESIAPSNESTILEALGLNMRSVRPSEKEKIKELLGNSAYLFHNAWAIENKQTQEKYDEYMDNHRSPSGRKIRTKLLWHGSKNENWISILKTGLLLRPNAAVTGKMFGSGIYFAPLAKKSIGYTSLRGSYWVQGSSNRAFMAVFETAYGTPMNVEDNHGFRYNFGATDLERKSNGRANCVHAHAGKSLRNDEIIYYKEEQVTIKYLVELRHS